MKRHFFYRITVLIVGTFLLAGCGTVSEPPKLKITSGDTEISYVVGKNKWDGAVIDREDNFKVIMKDMEISDLPYIKLNETIEIEFEENAPGFVELTDCILNPDGSNKYSEETMNSIDIQFKNKKGSFKLTENLATYLSSLGDDYEPGSSIRGFRFICKWDGNECEYAFILRSDPY